MRVFACTYRLHLLATPMRALAFATKPSAHPFHPLCACVIMRRVVPVVMARSAVVLQGIAGRLAARRRHFLSINMGVAVIQRCERESLHSQHYVFARCIHTRYMGNRISLRSFGALPPPPRLPSQGLPCPDFSPHQAEDGGSRGPVAALCEEVSTVRLFAVPKSGCCTFCFIRVGIELDVGWCNR